MKPTTPPPPGFAHLLMPTLLTQSTLDSLVKHLRAICVALENEVKRNPAKKHELAPAILHASTTWITVYKVHHERACAAAAKRDKGEVLWTVFRPTRNGYQEIIRTPNRKITIHWWKNYYDEGHHKLDKPEAESTELFTGRTNDPWGWDLRRAMDPEIN